MELSPRSWLALSTSECHSVPLPSQPPSLLLLGLSSISFAYSQTSHEGNHFMWLLLVLMPARIISCCKWSNSWFHYCLSLYGDTKMNLFRLPLTGNWATFHVGLLLTMLCEDLCVNTVHQILVLFTLEYTLRGRILQKKTQVYFHKLSNSWPNAAVPNFHLQYQLLHILVNSGSVFPPSGICGEWRH